MYHNGAVSDKDFAGLLKRVKGGSFAENRLSEVMMAVQGGMLFTSSQGRELVKVVHGDDEQQKTAVALFSQTVDPQQSGEIMMDFTFRNSKEDVVKKMLRMQPRLGPFTGPLDQNMFAMLIKRLKNGCAFASDRLLETQLACHGGAFFLSDQVKQILKIIHGDDEQIQAAVLMYPRTVDAAGFGGALTTMTFNSSKESVMEKVRGMHSLVPQGFSSQPQGGYAPPSTQGMQQQHSGYPQQGHAPPSTQGMQQQHSGYPQQGHAPPSTTGQYQQPQYQQSPPSSAGHYQQPPHYPQQGQAPPSSTQRSFHQQNQGFAPPSSQGNYQQHQASAPPSSQGQYQQQPMPPQGAYGHSQQHAGQASGMFGMMNSMMGNMMGGMPAGFGGPPPAHHMQQQGPQMMDPNSFKSLEQRMSRGFASDKKNEVILAVSGGAYFSSAQAKLLIKLVHGDSEQVEVAIALYNHIVDRQNFGDALSAMTFSSSKQKVMQAIQNQNH